VPDSSSAGVPPASPFPGERKISVRDRGRLPHWEAATATYFVTFRLADSLPQGVLRKIIFARNDILLTAARAGREITGAERKRLMQLDARKIEKYLDSGAGKCFLRRPVVAQIVSNAINRFDGTRYRLFAWCVMPNHVHVVFQALADNTLAAILHSWKSFTAKKANQALERSGEFWQREYYDHLIRDTAELIRAVGYVVNNPKKAGPNNWLWVWSAQ